MTTENKKSGVNVADDIQVAIAKANKESAAKESSKKSTNAKASTKGNAKGNAKASTKANVKVKTKEPKLKPVADIAAVKAFFKETTADTVERLQKSRSMTEKQLNDFSSWSDETWEKYESLNKPTQAIVWRIALLQEKIANKAIDADRDLIKAVIAETIKNL